MTKRFTKVTLFPEETKEIEERMEQVENLYLSHGIDFEPMVFASHEKMIADAMARNTKKKWRNYYANNMSYNLHDMLYEQFENKIGFDAERRPYFRLSENVKAYFKMLDDCYRPKGHKTGHVEDLNNSQGNLFGKSNINIYIGWRIRKDKHWDGLSGAYMVEMDSATTYKWVSSLSDLSARFGKNPALPTTPTLMSGDGIEIVPNIETKEQKTGTH